MNTDLATSSSRPKGRPVVYENLGIEASSVVFLSTQGQQGRAEGYGIVHADEQYIVPTDGKPIRGLIQVQTIRSKPILAWSLNR